MRRTALLPALCGVASLVLIAPPAQAAQPIQVWEPFEDSGSFLVPSEEDIAAGGPEEVCGFTVENPIQGEFSAEGEQLLQVRGNSENPYLARRGTSTEVFTNPDTGESLTVVREFFDKDLRIEDVSGTEVIITFSSVFKQYVYGPDGELIFEDQGRIQDAVRLDTNGTPLDIDDDEFLGFVPDSFRGTGNLEDRDFCEDFLEFTG